MTNQCCRLGADGVVGSEGARGRGPKGGCTFTMFLIVLRKETYPWKVKIKISF